MRGTTRLLIAAGVAAVPLILAVVAYASASDTAYGTGALASPGGGSQYNSAFGVNALHANVNAGSGTAVGYNALADNTNGGANTAIGANTMGSNTTGQYNTAVGASALETNVTGNANVAIGEATLFAATASDNTGVGFNALENTTTGYENVAVGKNALQANTTGHDNVAIGAAALSANTTGNANVAIGVLAGVDPSGNVSGSGNTFIGQGASPGTDDPLAGSTAVGANALVSQSNSVVIGAPIAKVGLGIEQPASKFQIGGKTTTYGDYLQIPVVIIATPPPALDCNMTTLVGRLVIQEKNKKLTLWGCNSLGKWVKI